MSALPDRVMTEDELRDLFVENAQGLVAELRSAVRGLCDDPDDAAGRLEAMAEAVHVLKGQGSSFGFPLITDIGRSLMTLLKDRHRVDDVSLQLIEIHVDALALVVDQLIEGDGGDLGAELTARLEAKVAALH